ncbi:MAG: FG-GAP-like repeat-containing protein, partial [Acidobacteriota bacterium]|nr:FG-GAP-like repeat-containing protein [Acidobacteriota bacterium]
YGSNGIAVADIDNDGWDEIYVCQPGGLPNRLYKNLGSGRLSDITEGSGLDLLDDTSCALFVDWRNSGQQDVVVLRGAGPLLFFNQGGSRFQLHPDAFRFADAPKGSFTGMAAADYDRDGKVDLYLCTYSFFQNEAQYRYPVPYHDAENGPANFLFRNVLDRNGGYFEDVTAAAGMNQNNTRFSFAPAWCDYNGDGWQDLYVANDFGRNNLYRNAKGHFEDLAKQAGVEDIGPGMSASWFDYDGDGRPDLYTSNMWSASGARLVKDDNFAPAKGLEEAYGRHAKGNSLYRNRGDGLFTETGAAEGVEMGRWAWASGGFDFDGDGAPEILTACGMLTNISRDDLMSFFWRQVVAHSPQVPKPAPAYENGWNAINQLIREDYSWNGYEPNVVYGRRGGRYYDFSGVSGLDTAEDGRAFAVTDLDGDGRPDLLIKNRLGPQLRAFQNNFDNSAQWIAFELTGTKSNRDAIGARVEAGGEVQFVNAGSGYLSQHSKRLHFGLKASRAARLVIIWPSGDRQEFEALESGYRYRITEGSMDLKRTAFAKQNPLPSAEVSGIDNAPRLHTTWFLEPVPLPEARPGPALLTLSAGFFAGKPDLAAWYSVFRRYLFDYRTPLILPVYLLIDDQSRACKIYADKPDDAQVKTDITALGTKARDALNFPGRYIAPPHRDYFKLGAAFYWAGYPDQALPYLSESLKRTPGNERVLLAIGKIHLQSGRPDQAKIYLDRAAALNPGSAEIWNELGGVAAAREDLPGALALYRKAMSCDP